MSEGLDRLFDRLEAAARKIESGEPIAAEEAEALGKLREAADSLPAAVGPAPPFLASRRRRRAIPLAAAAVLLVAAGIFTSVLLVRRFLFEGSPPGPPVLALSLDLRYLPGEAIVPRGPVEPQERRDRFVLDASRTCSVLVVFRSWDPARKSLAWLCEPGFPDRLEAGRPAELEMDVSGDPPIPQFLIVAADEMPGRLPRTEGERKDLVARLERESAAAGPAGLAASIAAVLACLPPDVSAFGKEFVVR